MKSLFARFRSGDPPSSSSALKSRPQPTSAPSQASRHRPQEKENHPLPPVPEALAQSHRALPLGQSSIPSPTTSIRALEPPVPVSAGPAGTVASGSTRPRQRESTIEAPGDALVYLEERHRHVSGEGKKFTFMSPSTTPMPSVSTSEPPYRSSDYTEASFELVSPVTILPAHRDVSSSSAGSGSTRSLASISNVASADSSTELKDSSKSVSTPSAAVSITQPQEQSKRSFFSLRRSPSAHDTAMPSRLHPRSPSQSGLDPIPQSTLSTTPSDVSLNAASYLPPASSWSEMAEDDLVANLGPKERTRQEVLWEIVSSEERYVQELVKLTDTFCRPLLPASAISPDHLDLESSTARSAHHTPLTSRSPSLNTSPAPDPLPIASRFASPQLSFSSHRSLASTPTTPNFQSQQSFRLEQSSSARQDAYNRLTNGKPKTRPSLTSLVSASRIKSHHSMPPPSRLASYDITGQKGSSRMSHHPDSIRTRSSFKNNRDSASSTLSARDELPNELQEVLKVVANGMREGHLKLVTALKKRYDDQYPLVRSLADIFNAHAYILRDYSTYVLHLEKALEHVEEALSAVSQPASRRSSRYMEHTAVGRLGHRLLELEENAADKGEASLVISLSMPFQRLLKYPLLFQNLLYNTDPSLREYEATLAMVDQVEEIVRTIEDEKASQEERERTRDAWARIEGLEKDKGLIVPRAGRLLVSEFSFSSLKELEGQLNQDRLATVVVQPKKSSRRVSDFLKGAQEKAELWVVEFTDVSLLCERTGVTYLPMGSGGLQSRASKRDSKTAQRRSVSQRTTSVRPRNLYKFVKVQEWNLSKRHSKKGMVSMQEIGRSQSERSILDEKKEQAQTGAHAPDDMEAKEQGAADPAAGDHHTLRKPCPSASRPVSFSQRALTTTEPHPSHAPSATQTAGQGSSTLRSKSGTVISDSAGTVMSFAFRSGDRLLPKTGTSRNASGPIIPVSGDHSATGRAAGRMSIPASGSAAIRTLPTATFNASTRETQPEQRRSASGHVHNPAAQAKFAHRLRSSDRLDPERNELSSEVEDDGGADLTIRLRPVSMKARKGLPPAMRNTPVQANPLHERAMGTASALAGRKSTASGTGAAQSARPPWNSSTRPDNESRMGKMSAPPPTNRPASIATTGGKGRSVSGGAETGGRGRSMGGKI